jgi:glyoxylase-like metal-dependent hydrolase (beta-lactamase superfamily II)
MKMTFHVTTLDYMHVAIPVPGCGMFFQQKLDTFVEVVGFFFLVCGDRHDIFVDTAMGLPPGVGGAKQQQFGNSCVEANEDTASVLLREGLPDDIAEIILSHLHTDRCWNVSALSQGKNLHVEDRVGEYRSYSAPAWIPQAVFQNPYTGA